MISRWLNNGVHAEAKYKKCVNLIIFLYPTTIEIKDRIRKQFLSILLCLLAVYIFPGRCLKPVSMETTRSQSGVLLCESCDPEPVVERCIEVGSQAVCWLHFIKRKIETVETEKLLGAQRRGRMRGLWLLQVEKENDCCPFMLRMHFTAQRRWMSCKRWGGCLLCWEDCLF